MKLLDALNRVERAGSEHSKATQKLTEAVERTAAEIFIRLIDSDLDRELDLGPCFFSPPSNVDRARLKIPDSDYSNGYTWMICDADTTHVVVTDTEGRERRIRLSTNTTRRFALDFAQWIAEGGLEKVEERITELKAESESAIAKL